MRFILLFFLCTAALINHSQTKFCGQMYYSTNFEFPGAKFDTDYLMLFNEHFSYSEEINIKGVKGDRITEVNDDDDYNSTTESIIVERKNKTPQYYYNLKNEFYFRTSLLNNKTIVVKEDDYDMHWEIKNETKIIGDFICKKATTSFRGNDYIAWFTTEIPLPYGPWKFKGLPGLILEVYDVSERFVFSTKKLIINDNTSCDSEKVPTDLHLSVSLKEYIDRQNKSIDEFYARLSSKLPKGSPPLKRSQNCDDCNLLEWFDY